MVVIWRTRSARFFAASSSAAFWPVLPRRCNTLAIRSTLKRIYNLKYRRRNAKIWIKRMQMAIGSSQSHVKCDRGEFTRATHCIDYLFNFHSAFCRLAANRFASAMGFNIGNKFFARMFALCAECLWLQACCLWSSAVVGRRCEQAQAENANRTTDSTVQLMRSTLHKPEDFIAYSWFECKRFECDNVFGIAIKPIATSPHINTGSRLCCVISPEFIISTGSMHRRSSFPTSNAAHFGDRVCRPKQCTNGKLAIHSNRNPLITTVMP